MLRLTVYGVEAAGLRPLAERLVYCKPAALLRLTALGLNVTDAGTFQAGKEVALKIAADNARGTTVLAAVLDEKLARADVPAGVADPAAHFYLATELEHPEALEDAEVLLADGDAAERALDLFLGTQGWRRFPGAGPTAELTLLTADNRDRVESAARAAVEDRRREAWEKAAQERTELQQERRRRAQAAQDAAEALAEYRALPRHYAALTAVAGLGVLFVAFVLCVTAALVQTARGRAVPRAAMGGACSALLLGVVVYFASEPLRSGERRDAPQVAEALLRQPWSELPRPEAPDLRPAVGNVAPQVVKSRPRGDRATGAGEGAAKDNNQQKDDQALQAAALATLRKQQQRSTMIAMAAMDRTNADVFAKKDGFKGGSGNGKGKTKDTSAPTQPIAPAPGDPTFKGEGDKADKGPGESKAPRQYTYDRRRPVTDLLLWRPALTLTDGSAVVRFPLPPTPGAYRVLLYGNTPDGRLGFLQQRLEAK